MGITVQELIDDLNKVEDKSISVMAYSDHGQENGLANSIGIMKVIQYEDGEIDLYCEEDYEDIEPENITLVYEIGNY